MGGIKGGNIYPPGTVVFENPSSTGTFPLELLQAGDYEVEVISSGSSGYHWDTGAAIHGYYTGGTGAYYKGILTLAKGTYSVHVGAGGTGTAAVGFNAGGANYITNSSNVDQLRLTGGGSSGGSLTVSTAEKTREAYNGGYNGYLYASGKDLFYYSYVGKRNAPVPSSLTSYGYGGGSRIYGGQSGGRGYMTITFLNG